MEARILIVDDDRDYLEVLSAKLVAAGFKDIRIEDDSGEGRIVDRKGRRF